MQVLVRLCILSHFNILKKRSYSTLSSYIQFNIGYHYSLSLSLSLSLTHSITLSLSFTHSPSLIILPNSISGTTILSLSLSLSLSYSFNHSLSHSLTLSLSLIILPNTVCCKYFMQVLVRYMYIISFP